MARLTPRDLKNSKRASGYTGVTTHPSWRTSSGDRYRAQVCLQHGPPQKNWYGPTRGSAREAAKDYCDYMNGKGVSPSIPRYPDVKIDMGNTKRHAPKLDPVKVVRPRHRGPYDVYDVLVTTAQGDLVCRKIGITATGHGRYADVCRTFGLNIKPHAPAVTHPSERAARVAEAQKIATVAADPAWTRIAKEAFIPVSEEVTSV